ncbi:MAG: AraC family transcriptional regulator [Eubacteriales bacterium]
MDFLTRITEAVNYIEDNLDDEINEAVLAKITCCSMHQFGRVFSYVCDMSLAEYIRRRRMTLAAADLQNGDKVIDTALKYGYDSPDSFAKAFIALHGVTPREAAKGAAVNYYPRISFHITIKGDDSMNYRIVEKEAFMIVGVINIITDDITPMPKNSKIGIQKQPDKELPDNTMNFLEPPDNDGMMYINFFAHSENLCRAPLWRFGVTQTTEDGKLVLAVGVEADNGEYHESGTWNVPGGTWAVFTVKGKLQYLPDDLNQHIYRELHNSIVNRRGYGKGSETMQPIDKIFARAEVEWMDESGYERAGNYEMMVYPLGDTESDDYYCEAWIPVRKK